MTPGKRLLIRSAVQVLTSQYGDAPVRELVLTRRYDVDKVSGAAGWLEKLTELAEARSSAGGHHHHDHHNHTHDCEDHHEHSTRYIESTFCCEWYITVVVCLSSGICCYYPGMSTATASAVLSTALQNHSILNGLLRSYPSHGLVC